MLRGSRALFRGSGAPRGDDATNACCARGRAQACTHTQSTVRTSGPVRDLRLARVHAACRLRWSGRLSAVTTQPGSTPRRPGSFTAAHDTRLSASVALVVVVCPDVRPGSASPRASHYTNSAHGSNVRAQRAALSATRCNFVSLEPRQGQEAHRYLKSVGSSWRTIGGRLSGAGGPCGGRCGGGEGDLGAGVGVLVSWLRH
jgi:hypothetical protein